MQIALPQRMMYLQDSALIMVLKMVNVKQIQTVAVAVLMITMVNVICN